MHFVDMAACQILTDCRNTAADTHVSTSGCIFGLP